MKRIMAIGLVAALVCLTGGVIVNAAMTPDELLGAVDQMTPEQVLELQQKLDATSWEPVPEGFFTRMAVSVGVYGTSLDTINLSSLSLSGGDMDVEDVGGVEFSVLWRAFSDQCRVGFRFGGWGTTDSNLSDAGYSSVDVIGNYAMVVANHQWVRSSAWTLWTELAAGSGYAEIETVDTPAGQATTLRRFDKEYGVADVQLGVSYSLNSVVDLFLAGGYRFAESITLEEGSRDSSIKFDASGALGRIGIGFNF